LADKNIELLWASPRELFNIIEADRCGVDIITVSHDLLAKINLFGKDLNEYSLETVKMFFNDASAAKYTI
jgi:transaldolase